MLHFFYDSKILNPISGKQTQKFKCCMFFYDSEILNPKLAANWFTNVKVIEVTPNPGVSGTDPLSTVCTVLFCCSPF